MKELNNNHLGLLLGGMMVIWHLVWSTLVLLGLAKLILDWVLWLHFISLPITIQTFDIVRAGLLLLVVFVVGYVVGWVAAWLWNTLIKRT